MDMVATAVVGCILDYFMLEAVADIPMQDQLPMVVKVVVEMVEILALVRVLLVLVAEVVEAMWQSVPQAAQVQLL
jgi:hypothetical protein